MIMTASVITIKDNEKSEEAADRCIASAKKHGLEVSKFYGLTPETCNIEEYFAENNIPVQNFYEKYSRLDRVMCAFASHHSLWRRTMAGTKAHMIFEHDAVMVDRLPVTINGHVVNFGKPSYGKYKYPVLGESRLTSKEYLPGAHAYMVTPFGAELLVNRAQVDGGPTDVFIHNQRFPGLLSEVYPWPVECRDSFTTIQNETGCLAKHNYGADYAII